MAKETREARGRVRGRLFGFSAPRWQCCWQEAWIKTLHHNGVRLGQLGFEHIAVERTVLYTWHFYLNAELSSGLKRVRNFFRCFAVEKPSKMLLFNNCCGRWSLRAGSNVIAALDLVYWQKNFLFRARFMDIFSIGIYILNTCSGLHGGPHNLDAGCTWILGKGSWSYVWQRWVGKSLFWLSYLTLLVPLGSFFALIFQKWALPCPSSFQSGMPFADFAAFSWLEAQLQETLFLWYHGW